MRFCGFVGFHINLCRLWHVDTGRLGLTGSAASSSTKGFKEYLPAKSLEFRTVSVRRRCGTEYRRDLKLVVQVGLLFFLHGVSPPAVRNPTRYESS